MALSMMWTGWDGSTWDLTNGPVARLIAGGVRGLSMPPVRRYVSQGPAVAGSRYRGHIGEEREVFWPLLLHVYPDDALGWVPRDQDFWRTLNPDRQGTWTVTAPDGTSRNLRCRYAYDDDHAFEVDPAHAGLAVYGITLVAEQPYWEGSPVAHYFTGAEPVPFFGEGFVIQLSPDRSAASASMSNSGDVPAWPVWTITGPTTDVTVGVDGRLIEVPFEVPDGEQLVIDTAPTAQTAITSAGVDRTAELGAVEFAPIPAGEEVPLSLTIVGTGSVVATVKPLFWRAW